MDTRVTGFSDLAEGPVCSALRPCRPWRSPALESLGMSPRWLMGLSRAGGFSPLSQAGCAELLSSPLCHASCLHRQPREGAVRQELVEPVGLWWTQHAAAHRGTLR